MGASAREAAVQLLQQVETGERHSGEALDALLRRTVLSPADQALVSRLFYGVLERRLTLDYVLSACSSVKLKKMHPAVRNNLRAGAYQLLYMDKIPSSAAVNEAVTLTRTLRQPYAAGLTNAVLRAVQRRAGGAAVRAAGGRSGACGAVFVSRGADRLLAAGLRAGADAFAATGDQCGAAEYSADQHSAGDG